MSEIALKSSFIGPFALAKAVAGNNTADYQNSPLAKVIADKTRVSSHEAIQLHKQAQQSAQALLATRASDQPINFASDEALPANAPDLRQPSVEINSNNAQQSNSPINNSSNNNTGKLSELMGRLVALLGDVSVDQLTHRLSIFQAFRESMKMQNERLSTEIDAANSEAEVALNYADNQQAVYQQAQGVLQQKQQTLDQITEKLSNLIPGSAEHTAALQEQQQAQAARDTALNAVQLAETNANQAFDVAQGKVLAAEKLLASVPGSPFANTPGLRQLEERQLSNTSRLTLLMAEFISMIGDNADTSLKNQLSMFEALQKGRQAEMEKKGRDFRVEPSLAVLPTDDNNRISSVIHTFAQAGNVAPSMYTGKMAQAAQLAASNTTTRY